MRTLWVTSVDPVPALDGQRLYSRGLIDATATAGGRLDVLCLANGESDRRPGEVDNGVRWWPVQGLFRPKWASVVSPLPNVAYRCDAEPTRMVLARMIREREWDAIVMDGLSAGWALPVIEHRFGRQSKRPSVVYVSHNHETTTRARVAGNYRGNSMMRYLLRRDAEKTRRLERRMIAAADLVTAITPEDASLFTQQGTRCPVGVLPPGYAGRRVARRAITAAIPRRVVMAGSFSWFAKQMNLEELVKHADSAFAAAGIELKVIGDGPAEFFERIGRGLRATTIVGRVPAVEPFFATSRIAVVPERSGGGFKLKILDYVFNRVPIAALDGTVAGTPLHAPETMLSFENMDGLVRGIVDRIDDLALLTGIQDRAYEACADRFEWRQRGRALLTWMNAA